jgi:hypothetical protein
VIRGRVSVALDRLAQRGLGRLELAGAPMHRRDDVPRIGRTRGRGARLARERFGFGETIERKTMARAQEEFESHRGDSSEPCRASSLVRCAETG